MFDEITGKVKFYNQETEETVFEKPTDFDGGYILGSKNSDLKS